LSPSISSSPAEIGRLKRRFPALPGFTYSTPSRSTLAGLCEWPDHDHSHAGDAGIEIKPLQVVDRNRLYCPQTQQRGLGQLRGPGAGVVIASHGSQRRERGQLLKNAALADIAAVDDVIAPLQKG